jgi:PAS domain S-box-containing protein
MIDPPPEGHRRPKEKAVSKDQLLQYAQDLARLYELERTQREVLEAANRKLQDEIRERTRLQEELRQSERKYRSLFEDSKEAVYVTTRDGILVDANDAYLKLCGYGRHELIGSSILKTYADPSVRGVFQKLVEENDGLNDFEFQIRKKDGTVLDCMTTAAVSRSADATILGYQGIVRDLTEQKRTQRMLELAKRMQALAHMAGGIAHEIRNPLAVSSSAAQLLVNDRVASHLKNECAEKVVSGINRASLIVENLLAFARPMTDYGIGEVNLIEVIRGTLTTITPQAVHQNVRLVTEFGSERLMLSGNGELLHRAFLNLFLNSLSAMPDGGVLSVAATRDGVKALIEVMDSGLGMSREQISHAFDPFFSSFPPSKGTGLGLSVAYSIVCHHGGAIDMNSALGKGSTLSVSLPLSPMPLVPQEVDVILL